MTATTATDLTATTATALILTGCDREPIHIPGTIQPYGVMLVAGRDDLVVHHAAGDVAGRLNVRAWLDQPLARVIGDDLCARVVAAACAAKVGGFAGALVREGHAPLDVSAHVTGDYLIVECEPRSALNTSTSEMMSLLEAAAATFERAPSLKALCDAAAIEFRRLTGYDRVMVYSFLDDDAGVVLAEDRREGLHSFLNHRFPAADIPQQARALYLRNLVRVIPDVNYQAAPLQPAWRAAAPLDMSDAHLRSVSPVHLQYLKNMHVGASASISIVKDGVLWGLIACHHDEPLLIPFEVRAACRALGGAMARQIKAREETEGYRERLRLRGTEDEIVALLAREGSLEDSLSNHLDDMQRFLLADGVIVMRGGHLVTHGNVPSDRDTRALADWLIGRSTERVFSTDRLAQLYPAAANFQNMAAGVLAVTLSVEDRWIMIWLRAEEIQTVQWAGNPHKAEFKPGDVLSPRASFEAWQETVRGLSRRWTPVEIEAAERIRGALVDVRHNRRIRDLNRQLLDTLDEKDMLLQQKQFLIGEVNHRVQNSLQLVSSFLALQARGSEDDGFKGAVEEARRRINAVSLVHRRLYRGDHVGAIDAGRYVQELCQELRNSMDDAWAKAFSVDAAPIMMATDKAVSLGLVLTELVININKYAYGGAPGPITVMLVEDRARFRLIVSDSGQGRTSSRKGFGSRMMAALVSQLGGELTYGDNNPGLRATLAAPVEGGGDAQVAGPDPRAH